LRKEELSEYFSVTIMNAIIGLKEKIQMVYNEADNLALKAISKEHSPFTL
jgi:hypothetical protein